jgi:hypothetical protein
MGEEINAYRVFMGRLEGKRSQKDLDEGGRIVLKRIVEK